MLFVDRLDVTGVDFSPDSRWLVYQKPHPTRMAGLWLYSLEAGRTVALGDGLTADFGPAWSADGKHLFFTGLDPDNDTVGRIFWVSAKVIDNAR